MRHLPRPNLARGAALVQAVMVAFATLAVGAPAHARPPTSGLTNERAKQHLARAQEAFDREDYAAALPELKSAYALDPSPALLYAWAQAERFNGDCRRALDLYRRYLATDPPTKQRNLAEANVVDCEAEVGTGGTPPFTPGGADAPAAGPAEPVQHDELPAGQEPDTKPWFKDWLAPTLAGVGFAGAGAGVAFVVLGVRQGRDAPAAITEMDYLGAGDSARTKHTTGWVLVGLGGAFMIAGAVRYAILATRPRKPKAEHAPLRSRIEGAGLAVRF